MRKDTVRKEYKFYSDAGHGWLAVKIVDCFLLGVAHKITPYSYVRGLTAYLEEDCDAPTYLQAYVAKYGEKPSVKDSAHRPDHSPIRSYDDWNMQYAENIWKNSSQFPKFEV